VRVVVAELVDRVLAVEDIDLLAVGGDGAGTVAVGGDLGPARRSVGSSRGKGKSWGKAVGTPQGQAWRWR
jgi:hypothetical protein